PTDRPSTRPISTTLRLGLLSLLLTATLGATGRAQDDPPTDEEAARQFAQLTETAREEVGEAAEMVGEGLGPLCQAAGTRVGAAVRNAERRIRAAIVGEEPPRKRGEERIMVAPAVPAAPDEAQIQRLEQQLRPYVRSELYLVRTICKP